MSDGLHERLAEAVGERTFRGLAELTGTPAETVRRYMQGQAPSAEFLASVCSALRVSGDWLLTGRGPMRVDDVKAEALRRADPGELLAAMSKNMERLLGRVERLEVFVQTMEARLRARRESAAAAAIVAGVGSGGTVGASTTGSERDGAAAAVGSQSRARGIGDAVPQRPRPDAG